MSAYDEVARLVKSRARDRKMSRANRQRKFLSSSKEFLARKVAPRTGWLRNLASIPLTATGAGLIDFSAFHLAHGWGWLVTGVSLIVLEYVVADQES